jgi:L-ascorbate metabolism protein UlaG (beta-lactamase superfamily)
VASADTDALAGLDEIDLGLPAGLQIEWLGVSGYRMTFEGTSIFIDPYVSRVPLRALLLRRKVTPDPAMIDRFIHTNSEVAGVLVGHTHFDHAIDAPEIARRANCKTYGSASLAHLMGLYGMRDQSIEVKPFEPYELGPFVVRFIPSVHSKLILGRKIPMDGEFTCDHVHDLTPGAYRCGQVWGIRIDVAGVSFYHQGSADLIDDAIPEGTVDYFLAGVAGRSVTPRYWERILPKLDPRVVVPTHYDNFFKPLGEGNDFAPRVKLAEVPDEVRAVSRDATVATLKRIDL